MNDAAGLGQMVKTARLVRDLDAGECMRRNALTNKRPGLRLVQGATVTVLETLDQGKAFLVEFGAKTPEKCEWLGVLYPTEIEFVKGQPRP